MKAPYDLDRLKLLKEAPDLVKKAVRYGWISYPSGIDLDDDGNVEIDTEDDLDNRITKHTSDVCRQAYILRDRGLTLEQVAKFCKVAVGSVHYIIAKGHEEVLKEQRISEQNNKTEVWYNSTKESP
jgi:DNA-directed RNA polymerase specialized sigma24 family protein